MKFLHCWKSSYSLFWNKEGKDEIIGITTFYWCHFLIQTKFIKDFHIFNFNKQSIKTKDLNIDVLEDENYINLKIKHRFYFIKRKIICKSSPNQVIYIPIVFKFPKQEMFFLKSSDSPMTSFKLCIFIKKFSTFYYYIIKIM